jgi:hypothetical protein
MMASHVQYHAILAQSVDRNADLRTGLICTLRAPIDVLVAGLFGLDNADQWLGGGPDLVLGILLVIGTSARGLEHPLRPLLWGGLALMVGGYGMTFSVRNAFGPHWLMEVQRYHLFPQLGFVLVLTGISRPWVERFDRRPRSSLLVATVLAVLLLVAHRPILGMRARVYRFPDQARTLKALERLEDLCREHRITRAQVLAAFDPIGTHWFHQDSTVLIMLADSVRSSDLPDDRVRPTLLSALCLSDREALCGGMDVSAYLRPAGEPPNSADPLAVGQLVGAFGVSPVGPGKWYLARGPACLEFQMNDTAHPDSVAGAHMLWVPVRGPKARIELWWTGEGIEWSETRSVHWRPVSGPTGPWAVPLDRLPHWSPLRAAHIRVVVRSVAPVAVEAPRFLR